MRMHQWAGRRVLVTGATGIVGARLCSRLLDLGCEIVAFVRDHDPLSPLWLADDVHRVRIASGRLECFEQVKSAVLERDVDTVFHLGAQALVHVGARDPLGTLESNVRGTYHVLEACRMLGDALDAVVVASTDKVYGEAARLPTDEDAPLLASGPYDVSKACADHIARMYAGTYHLPVAIARCGNIYGPGDLNFSRLVPSVMRDLLHERRPVIRSDGSLRRDYLALDDAVDAYLMLAEWATATSTNDEPQRAFNFSGEEPLTVLEMVRRIQSSLDREDLAPDVRGTASGEIEAQHLDASRARGELGWRAHIDLDTGLAITGRWYRAYFETWSSISVVRRQHA